MPILNYIGTMHSLKPADPMANYKGEKAVEHYSGDYSGKHMGKILFASDENRPALLEALTAENGPMHTMLISLSSKCLGDTKFLCGDELTIHDFCVAGAMCNVTLNPLNVKVGP
jgi:glutathione S-transferase